MTPNTSDIFLAGGCFWGTEHFFKMVDGVEQTRVGYANGNTANPTYQEVCHNNTGHAETVHVVYNSQKVTLNSLLQLYFKIIDPTSLNCQGEDHGTQYRTGIYYTNPKDLTVIEDFLSQIGKNYAKPLVVEVLPLKNFYPAEEYHQDYLDKNPGGYCHISPELFEWARQTKKTER